MSHTHTHTHRHTAHAHTHAHTRTHIHAHTHTHIHAHTHMCTCTHAHLFARHTQLLQFSYPSQKNIMLVHIRTAIAVLGLHQVLASVSVSDQYQHFLMVLELVKYVTQVPILLFTCYICYYNGYLCTS